MAGLVAIKWAAWLKIAPSPTSSIKFTVRWTSRNTIRNSPVILIINFFPMDELKISIIALAFNLAKQVRKSF
jgi:hypothetical protein